MGETSAVTPPGGSPPTTPPAGTSTTPPVIPTTQAPPSTPPPASPPPQSEIVPDPVEELKIPSTLPAALEAWQNERSKLSAVNRESAERRIALRSANEKISELSTREQSHQATIAQLTEQLRIVKVSAEVHLKAYLLGFRDPMDAVKFVDLTQFKLDEKGAIVGDVEAALKKLASDKPYLVSGSRAPSVDGKQGSTPTGGETVEDRERALRERYRL